MPNSTELPLIEKFSLSNSTLLEKIPQAVVRAVDGANPREVISKNYPYRSKLSRRDYEREKRRLQIELVKMQNWMLAAGKKLVIVFEGRDAAGKGGTIKRFMEHLNPRHARVVALTKPTEIERGQWYFQRYISQLPTEGHIAFFDRSWYNRAGVERVMGFCTPNEYTAFMRQAPEFERMLIESDTRLIKFWFSVSREEQLRRFVARAHDPLKQWKLSEMDFESLPRWDDYTVAKESMFYSTDTEHAPWVVIRSDDKKRARINALRYVLTTTNYAGKDPSNLEPIDPLIIGSAQSIYEDDEVIQREKLRRRRGSA